VPRPRRLRSQGGERQATGFTLIELLIVVGIIALLLAIVIPSLTAVRQQAKTLICMDHLRLAAFNFRLFADPYAYVNRGDSTEYRNRFLATDFLDSLYVTDEFWTTAPKGPLAQEAYKPGQEPILCPAGPRELYRRPDKSCDGGGVSPLRNISYAMNRRLLRAPRPGGGLTRVLIWEHVLDHPNVPLLFDADGEAAWARSLSGDGILLSAPQTDERDDYYSGKYWHPAKRHRKKMNIGFVGGHVVSTAHPLKDPSWDWKYHPPLDR
jgi:prepilin-type N-terminal cleavage/methylation domain-containing protein/prepilin-type processing-associated H-X9-DG protein